MWLRPTLLLVLELQHFRCGGENIFCSDIRLGLRSSSLERCSENIFCSDIRLGLRSNSLERGGGGRPFFCSCYLRMVVPRRLATRSC